MSYSHDQRCDRAEAGLKMTLEAQNSDASRNMTWPKSLGSSDSSFWTTGALDFSGREKRFAGISQAVGVRHFEKHAFEEGENK
jgi:hypothetical protein